MRQRIIDYLIFLTGSVWIKYSVPTGFTIYVISVLAVWLVMRINDRKIGLAERIPFLLIVLLFYYISVLIDKKLTFILRDFPQVYYRAVEDF
jgi:hypothetical protein